MEISMNENIILIRLINGQLIAARDVTVSIETKTLIVTDPLYCIIAQGKVQGTVQITMVPANDFGDPQQAQFAFSLAAIVTWYGANAELRKMYTENMVKITAQRSGIVLPVTNISQINRKQ